MPRLKVYKRGYRIRAHAESEILPILHLKDSWTRLRIVVNRYRNHLLCRFQAEWAGLYSANTSLRLWYKQLTYPYPSMSYLVSSSPEVLTHLFVKYQKRYSYSGCPKVSKQKIRNPWNIQRVTRYPWFTIWNPGPDLRTVVDHQGNHLLCRYQTAEARTYSTRTSHFVGDISIFYTRTTPCRTTYHHRQMYLPITWRKKKVTVALYAPRYINWKLQIRACPKSNRIPTWYSSSHRLQDPTTNSRRSSRKPPAMQVKQQRPEPNRQNHHSVCDISIFQTRTSPCHSTYHHRQKYLPITKTTKWRVTVTLDAPRYPNKIYIQNPCISNE